MGVSPVTRAQRETLAFLDSHLAGRPRVLDVGCGRGDYARMLAGRGHEVVAVDPELPDPAPSAPGARFQRIDFLAFEAPSFDALVFVTSLHHIWPLEEALAHAHRLLKPGGIFLAEEFALEAPDEATARWYYDAQERLASAGRYGGERIHGAPSHPLLQRWAEEHDHEARPGHAHGHPRRPAHGHGGRPEHAGAAPGHPQHGPLTQGHAMIAEVARRFELLDVSRGPYLYRYIESGVREASAIGDPAAERLVDELFEDESRAIGEGQIQPVGLRLIARRR